MLPQWTDFQPWLPKHLAQLAISFLDSCDVFSFPPSPNTIDSISACILLPDEQRIILSYHHGQVVIWHLVEQTLIQTISLGQFTHKCQLIACSSDFSKFYTTAQYLPPYFEEHSLCQWDFNLSGSLPVVLQTSRKTFDTENHHGNGFTAMECDTLGKYIYTGSRDGSIRQWLVQSKHISSRKLRRCCRVVKYHTQPVRQLALSRGFLFSSDVGGEVHQWIVNDFSMVHSQIITAKAYPLTRKIRPTWCQVSPNHQFLFVIVSDTVIQQYQIHPNGTLTLLNTLRSPGGTIEVIYLARDSAWLYFFTTSYQADEMWGISMPVQVIYRQSLLNPKRPPQHIHTVPASGAVPCSNGLLHWSEMSVTVWQHRPFFDTVGDA